MRQVKVSDGAVLFDQDIQLVPGRDAPVTVTMRVQGGRVVPGLLKCEGQRGVPRGRVHIGRPVSGDMPAKMVPPGILPPTGEGVEGACRATLERGNYRMARP